MAGNSSRPGATVASRVLALLGAFDHDHRAMTLTQLAGRAGLPLPTAHRLAGELVAWGALVRRASGEYVVGRRMWDLGLLAPVQSGLREVASPFLHDLYGATLATVHLAVRDDTSVLYVDRLAGHVSVPVISQVGSRLPLHATGVGKVLLAHAPEDVRARALARLTRVTAYTITQPGRLRAELRRVVRDGFAQTSEEMSLGACSVAVPIHAGADVLRDGGAVSGRGDPEGHLRDNGVVAALGLVVPRLGRDRGRLLAALRVAARGIGRSLEVPGAGSVQ